MYRVSEWATFHASCGDHGDGGGGDGGGGFGLGGGEKSRPPQSAQSVPYRHEVLYTPSDPGPPSLHTPLLAYELHGMHVFSHICGGCGGADGG